MSRKVARDYVYKLIFEYSFTHQLNMQTFDMLSMADVDASDIEYMRKVYTGVAENYDTLLENISRYSHGFQLDRIYKPDLCALLLAIYEMKYMDDIPLSVSISEAVLLVKKYSTEKSNSFVNGILSSVYKEIENK